MNIEDRVKQLEEELQSVSERLSDVRATHSIKHDILSATHEDTIVAVPANNDILHYSGGDWQKTDSPSLDDLTIVAPVNIYALSHDSFADFVANKHIDHTIVSVIAGTGLSGGGTIDANKTINLSHLGIQSLADPGADRIMFWDETANAMKWLSLGNSLNIVLTVMDTIQDIRTTASPEFAALKIGAGVRDTLLHIEGGNLTVQGAAAISRIVMKDSAGNTDGYIHAESGVIGFLDEDGSWAMRANTDVDVSLRVNNQVGFKLGADLHIDIYDWVDAVTREVSFGADDSGDPGFKVLQVPN